MKRKIMLEDWCVEATLLWGCCGEVYTKTKRQVHMLRCDGYRAGNRIPTWFFWPMMQDEFNIELE